MNKVIPPLVFSQNLIFKKVKIYFASPYETTIDLIIHCWVETFLITTLVWATSNVTASVLCDADTAAKFVPFTETNPVLVVV